ncbi:tetratricopeptide repeat protein [Streptomyces sp. NPDC046197]|uniref:tetratricopeptide repeat protein n=1 Tax=Streptomyces sp. NPDC046197 TaxID=3154337 RepID=UPI0033D5F6BF
MGNRQQSPAASLMTESRRGRRRLRQVFLSLVTIAALLGAAWMVLPAQRRPARPAPGPGAPGAQGAPGAPAAVAAGVPAAVAAGVPAALPALSALIGDRERHLRAQPRDAQAWAVLGAAYVERAGRTADAADYPRADTALRTSLRLAPARGAQALGGLAALANGRRDFQAARSWGEQALKLEPKRWTTYPPLIDAYTGLGDYQAAQRTLDQLVKLHHGPAVKATAAAVYWDRGWREDAAAQLSDAAAAAATPAERAAYLEQAGRIAWERGDRDDALRHFEAAARLDPDQWAALAGQGRTLAALGRTTEAVRAYQSALDKQPRPEYALELGELYESMGQEQWAQAQYGVLRSRVRRDAAAGVDDDLVLGRFEADHGDAESAVRRLRAEWQRQPGIAVADALGWALHRTGEDEEALKFATQATDRTKGGGVRSALYAYHRGMIEQDLDLTGPARRHLEEALRTNPYFSPLGAPDARAALEALGEAPAEELPADVAPRQRP